MAKWILNDGVKNEVVVNRLDELGKRYCLVAIEDLEKLKENNIKCYTLSDKLRKCYFVRQGKKPKRFRGEQLEQIKKDLEKNSIRQLSVKYKCSTRTIQQIKKGEY